MTSENERSDIKQLQDKIQNLEIEISRKKKKLLDTIINSFKPAFKCEWCGCYDGIHKSNCYIIIKYY